jgi:cytoskeleton protein RodZ
VNADRIDGACAQAPRDTVELAARLREERETLGWTVAETALKLKMPAATLAELEAARFDRLGTPVYLKGYLRSYAELLGHSADWYEAALAAGMPATPPLLPAAGAVTRRIAWIDRYKWAVSYVVGTALALTAVHWLVNNTPQLGGPAQPIAAPPTPPASSTPLAPSPASAAPPAVTATADPAPSAPVLASLAPFGRVPFEATPEAEAERAAGREGLVLRFDERSWIEVKDADGRVLRSGLVSAGETLQFDEGAWLSVRIGNIGGVRVSVDGVAADVSQHTRGNVATFRVVRAGDAGWQLQEREASHSSRGEG